MNRPHSPFTPRRMAWLTYCRKCGLVYLRNDPTRAALRAPCPDYEPETR